MMARSLDTVIQLLEDNGFTLYQFLSSLLTSQSYDNHESTQELLAHSVDIFSLLWKHPSKDQKLFRHVIKTVQRIYHLELKEMASDRNWHFGALSTTTNQLEEFCIEDLARDMGACAPELTSLLGVLLVGEEGHSVAGIPELEDREGDASTRTVNNDSYWDEVDEIDLEGFINALTSAESHSAGPKSSLAGFDHTSDKRSRRRTAITTIKKTVIFSMLMQSINQKANPLQSILGIFFQSAHTPQKVTDTLARIGISISTETINGAIRSLSIESQNKLRTLGQSLLASYAYDNFDVDLKSHTPTTERSTDTLKHLTSGLLFPLGHGITADDLKCSDELWRMSALNPQVDESNLPLKKSWRDLLHVHPESGSASQPSRRDRFNAWVFLSDLCTHGPAYFHQFKTRITEPEAVDQIPLVKTEIIAACAMDVNNSTVSGNIRAVNDLLQQGGIYDPVDTATEDLDTPDISQHIVLIHGDLGTGERLQTAQLRRSIEVTPWDRLQHVLFIPGLFHVKMACAEAIWRCFIQPPAAREDETSLIHDVALLRPRETGIFCSKPGFRRMHQLIGHAGICRRLDCWRVHIKNKGVATSLDAFASLSPTFEDLQAIANELTQTYVANYQLRHMRKRPAKERDIQFENATLMIRYFLLYEELSYAMNRGDIGRTETCIVHWIPILKAVGKHKYATQMTNFLINVHFVYPLGLRRAIRYHWLVNPTGKPMKWRAVDWCVELNNLFTKVKNGGTGPNRTVERIILESPLVQAYRNAQAMIQQNFLHTHLNIKHSDPNMTKTFTGLTTRLEVHTPHMVSIGRKSRYEIVDMVDKGRELMEKAVRGEADGNNEDPTIDTVEETIELDDVLVGLL